MSTFFDLVTERRDKPTLMQAWSSTHQGTLIQQIGANRSEGLRLLPFSDTLSYPQKGSTFYGASMIDASAAAKTWTTNGKSSSEHVLHLQCKLKRDHQSKRLRTTHTPLQPAPVTQQQRPSQQTAKIR
jgi:hypothetical protein